MIKKILIGLLINISLFAQEKEYILKNRYVEYEYFYNRLIYFDIKYPEIVFCQAILETGWFKSLSNKHNYFGLVDSNKSTNGKYVYMYFDTFEDGILGYKKYIQYKLNDNEDYYDFLNRIGYAENKKYTDFLIVLKKQIFDEKEKF